MLSYAKLVKNEIANNKLNLTNRLSFLFEENYENRSRLWTCGDTELESYRRQNGRQILIQHISL